MLHLEQPSPAHKKQAMEFREDFIIAGETMNGGGALMTAETYEQWLQHLARNSNPETRDPGRVANSTFFAIDGFTIVGIINLRHHLTPELLKTSGHVGYSIAPSQQGKGYATRMLSLLLPYAKTLAIDKLLVTCFADNPASARVIEKNGGMLEGEVPYKDTIMRRYWITLLPTQEEQELL